MIWDTHKKSCWNHARSHSGPLIRFRVLEFCWGQAKDWQVPSSGPQYGTLERGWAALCTEAEKVSELHMEVKATLMGEDYEKLKNWQKDAYHKQMIGGFKETKEAEDGFRKAQKPWAKKLKEVWSVI